MSDIIWTPETIELFRSALNAAIKVLDVSNLTIQNWIRQHTELPNGGRLDTVLERSIARFRTGETQRPQTKQTLSAMLHAVGVEARRRSHLSDQEQQQLQPLFQLHDTLIEYHESDVQPDKLKKASSGSVSNGLKLRSDNDTSNIINALLSYLALPADRSVVVADIFMQKNQEVAHFLTYRFSSNVGQVVKSLTVVRRPKLSLPVTTFANFRKTGEDATRICTGIAIKFGQEISFIGHSDNGNALKTLTFNPLAGVRDLYTGLMTTNDTNEGGLAARFIMKRTKEVHHLYANTGKHQLVDLRSELSSEDIDNLRNRVKFKLEETIFDKAGKEVKQRAIVSHTGNVFFGDNILRYENGDPFNPADENHYTYNSALKYQD